MSISRLSICMDDNFLAGWRHLVQGGLQVLYVGVDVV